MTEVSGSRRVVVGGLARNAAISTWVGVAFLFLIFVGRQEFWGWRLALYGALGGFAVYVFCHFLDATVGDRIRRWKLVPDKVVGVPLYFVGGCAGFIATTAAIHAVGLMPFDLGRRDLRIALLFSGGISIVVGLLFYSFEVMRGRLRKSIERIKEQEFAEKELALARSIQSRLLPPAEMEGPGYRIAARNLPARFVAGDFYDVFPLSDGTVGLVVADVSGKGIGASLIMASVKSVVPLVASGRSVSETLRELNRKLSAELAAREFVALACARYDTASGSLELANAGLPDPYFLDAGESVRPLSVPGPRLPLGIRPDVAYESLTVSLAPGRRVLFLTDGIPEARTGNGDPLGYEALALLLAEGSGPPAQWLDSLLDRVRAVTSGALEDDWTVLLLERRGAA
ncbi:MAG: PP2C family protein-serine/threonine phosphatase [Thermoanaerobaculia bacterium]